MMNNKHGFCNDAGPWVPRYFPASGDSGFVYERPHQPEGGASRTAPVVFTAAKVVCRQLPGAVATDMRYLPF